MCELFLYSFVTPSTEKSVQGSGFKVQWVRWSDGLAIMLYLCVQSVIYVIFLMHYIVTLNTSYHLCGGTFSVLVGEAFN